MFVAAIIGGKNVTNPHLYPWMVQIVCYDIESENSQNFSPCGGAIISENMILTNVCNMYHEPRIIPAGYICSSRFDGPDVGF